MNRAELEHAIRASCQVAGDTEVWVIGSQSILGAFPDAPSSLLASMEVDIVPVNRPERADDIDGALGEFSPFHEQFGFYVHGLSIESATLPTGWRARAVRVRNEATLLNSGLCLAPKDLAASKLAAFRHKDTQFVRLMLAEKLVSAKAVVTAVAALPLAVERRKELADWVRLASAD